MPGVPSTSIAAELGASEPPTTAAVATAAGHFAMALARRLEVGLGGLLPPDAAPAAELSRLSALVADPG